MAVSGEFTSAGGACAYAYDGDTGTPWNAGAAPTQYLQLDLGRTRNIKKVRLHTSQTSTGVTSHDLYTSHNGSSLTLGSTLTGTTSNVEWLQWVPTNPVGDSRYLRVTTTSSASNVGWYEIEVFE